MNDVFDSDPGPLTEEDRRKILGRIHSLLYWLGKFIPEEELLERERVQLRDVIFNYVTKQKPTEEEVQGALFLADALEGRAKQLESELSEGDLTKGQAHILLDEICGLLRAVDEIRHAQDASAQIKAKALMSRVTDEKRWLSFVRSVS
ncbi:MAG: DUF5788 family protein [Methanomassiliicoccales archaeon]|nr:DUF5788 family protein [Methanomassiliicoccales archaeon]